MAPNNNDDQFNADELEPPQWLNVDFFTKVLRQSKNNDALEVTSLNLSPGTAKGDHYASIMFRAALDYRQQGGGGGGVAQSQSLIVKIMPEVEGNKKELLQESHLFETEIGMYTIVIPKIEQILRAIGNETTLGATCIYHSLHPKQLIIFEDLVPQGYTVIRDRFVNLKEAKQAYLKLAKLHAVSYKLLSENPAQFDKFRHGLMTISNMINNEFMNSGIKHFIKLLDSVPTLQKYKPYFEAMEPSLFNNVKASFVEYRNNPLEHAHYVLCHGDFHCKNMMFKINEQTGTADDVILLDFQMSYVGPMAHDLIYSIYMILDNNLRVKHFDEILYYYFTNFIDILRKIGFAGRLPKLSELRAQLMQNKDYELYLLMTFLPMWYAMRNNTMDPDLALTSFDYRQTMYEDQQYVVDVQTMLEKYLHLGYFDNL